MIIVSSLISTSYLDLKRTQNFTNTCRALLSKRPAHIFEIWQSKIIEFGYFVIWNDFDNILFIITFVKVRLRLTTGVVGPETWFKYHLVLTIIRATRQFTKGLKMTWKVYFDTDISLIVKQGEYLVLLILLHNLSGKLRVLLKLLAGHFKEVNLIYDILIKAIVELLVNITWHEWIEIF